MTRLRDWFLLLTCNSSGPLNLCWSRSRRVGKKDGVEFPVGKVLFETDVSDFHFNPIRFSPDGRRIAFVYMAVLQAKLAVPDLDGNVHQLGPLAPNGKWSPGPISWSPDGKEI